MMEDLPPGFRFFPTEEELVGFYLHNKLEGNNINAMDRVIPVIDINGVEPWSLPTLAGERCRGDREQWFFFAPGQAREARGGRPNRTTGSGYWKATGSPGYVYSSENTVIGVKKTMVFYKGRAPTGRKTKWKMNEYRAIQLSHQSATPSSAPQLRREFSLCRIYVVSGSFRAFDRRPLENNNNNNNNNPRTESHDQHEIIDQNRDIIAPSSSSFAYSSVIDASTSSEITHIGEIIVDHNNAGVGSSSTNWWNNVNNNNDINNNYYGVHQVQEPVWEWGEINWL